tara:strand:+ start:18815 stop:19264 length:450 start_codon:yes stop_codon:yes gene_type:complete
MPKINLANEGHLNELARLFNLYRVFYKQPFDKDMAIDFIKLRMKQKQSIVFVAEESDGILSGFVQLYPSFCSVSAIPVLILYDLFVDEEERGKGIGRNLMNKSTEYAKLNGFKRLELSTAKDNVIGQSLYESLDYELDEEFLHYSLEVK